MAWWRRMRGRGGGGGGRGGAGHVLTVYEMVCFLCLVHLGGGRLLVIMQRQVLWSSTEPVSRRRGGASASVHRQSVLPCCEQRQVPKAVLGQGGLQAWVQGFYEGFWNNFPYFVGWSRSSHGNPGHHFYEPLVLTYTGPCVHASVKR